MSASLLEVQRTILAAVQTALPGISVFDHDPQQAQYPFVRVGDDSATDWSTDTEQGLDCSLQLHFWSRYRGNKEIKQMMDAVRDYLSRSELAVIGATFISIEFEQDILLDDPDGKTKHGVQRFRLLVDE